jgi:L-lysine 2,3-aminomutase
MSLSKVEISDFKVLLNEIFNANEELDKATARRTRAMQALEVFLCNQQVERKKDAA